MTLNFMRLGSLINLYYFGIFTLLFFFTLNFNYVEGDDATTVLYHLCERNKDVQQPYAAYNSGIDFIIQVSGLETEESIRVFAVFISFLSGLFILFGCRTFLEAFFKSSNKIQPRSRSFFYILLPFIVPDILFHSLFINSANISFAFLLFSLTYFIRFLKSDKNYWLVLSMVLFAIAIPFRWTMLVSLSVYAGLLLYFSPIAYSKTTFLLYLKVFIAALLGLTLVIALFFLTGYNLRGVYEAIASTVGILAQADFSALSILATASAFLTPSLLFLLLLCLFKMREIHKSEAKFNYGIAVFLVLAVSPFFLLGFFPSYKFLITLFPALLVLMLLGFDYLMQQKILFSLLVMSLVFVWFFGIQIDAGGTFCGPGFELNTGKAQQPEKNRNEKQNIDQRVKINGISLKPDSGFYMPMLEGPRPLYGYFYVFFNGWFNQIEALKNERQKVVGLVMGNKDIDLIQDRRTSYISCDLYKNGYKTTTNFRGNKSYLYRDFVKGNDTIQLKVVPDDCSKVTWIADLPIQKNKKVIYRSSYSSEILQLYHIKKGGLKIIGPFTAIIE
jgi:hypothetical protein